MTAIPPPLLSSPVSKPHANDVFISYAPGDFDFARELYHAMVRQGRDPWIDWEDIPADYRNPGARWQFVEAGIQDTDLVVFILSPEALQSFLTLRELDLFQRFQKPIVPILCKALPENTPVPSILSQWIVQRENAIEPFEELTQAIYALQVGVKLQRRAEAWKTKQDPKFLLSHSDLKAIQHWQNSLHQEPLKTLLNYQCNALQRDLIQASQVFVKQVQEPTQPDVFVSYSRKDKPFAIQLCNALKEASVGVWVDWDNIPIAADWRQEIFEGIDNAHTFLFLLSPDSVSSKHCRDELEQAIQKGKKVIPIGVRKVEDAKKAQLQEEFNSFKKLWSVQGPQFYPGESFEENIAKLRAAINQDLEIYKEHAHLLREAKQWREKQRPLGLLLNREEYNTYMQVKPWKEQLAHQGQPFTPSAGGKYPPLTDLQIEFLSCSQREIGVSARIRTFQAIATLMAVFGLGTLSWFLLTSRVGQINTLVSSLEESRGLDALTTALEAGRQMKGYRPVNWFINQIDPNLQSQVITALHKEIYNLREINRLDRHKTLVRNALFSPKDRIIASVGDDRKIYLWNQEGKATQVLEEHRDNVTTIDFDPAFDPIRQILISGSKDGAVIVWNLSMQSLIPARENFTVFDAPEGHTNRVNSVRFSTGGWSFASASDDGTVKIWHRRRTTDPFTSLFEPLPITLVGHAGPVTWADFNRWGDRVASASLDGTVRIWSVGDQTTSPTSVVLNHGSPVLHVVFSPDGKLIASAGLDGTIKLWTPEGKQILPSQKQGTRTYQHEGAVYRLAFSPDGQTLASASEDGTVRLWNRDGTWLRTLRGHQGAVYRVQFSRDGQRVASAGKDRTIKLWISGRSQLGVPGDTFGKLLDTLEGHDDAINSVAFSQDGDRLISASIDKTLRLWTLENLTRILPHNNRVNDVSFFPTGEVVASGGLNSIRLWQTAKGTLIGGVFDAHKGNISSLQFSPDGQRLASAGEDQQVKLWQVEASGGQIKLLKVLTGHLRAVNSISFSPDSRFLASAGDDRTIRLWDAQEGRLLKTLEEYHPAAISGITFNPRLSRGQTGSLLWMASATRAPVDSEGKVGQARIILWQMPQLADGHLGQPVPVKTLNTTADGHQGDILSVAFSPVSDLLASSGNDGTVKLWRFDGTLVRTLPGDGTAIAKISFSPDGNLLALADQKGTVRLWRTTGTFLTTFRRHESELTSVSFSPQQGRLLASASADSTVLLWDMPEGFDNNALNKLLDRGCQVAWDFLESQQNRPLPADSFERQESQNVEAFCKKTPHRKYSSPPKPREVN